MSALSKPVKIGVLGLAGLLFGLGVLGLFWPPDEEAPVPVSLAQGARLYGEFCAACHGVNLEGEANWRQRRPDGYLPAPPHDASGHSWHHPDQQLFAITKFGSAALVGGGYKSNMPGFAEALSDSEIWGVFNFIRSRWPQDIQDKQQEISARAAKNAQ